ncbi:hypothetical protein [Cellvibrio japonicus]|nr:hypothetical protein [Cellvibrio japonicus]QEI12465.1 hypothetical protein FY117_09680 [Cellvibrio japonicus]QEI16039.1 hypothetical protein FY116_09685 [Cellvibrio japonicus]QEI19617.1 hypothetical protein FY115_09680 [Cellvibrio japonicus]
MKLSPDVKALIHANQKIHAVKLLHEQQGISLKDAREQVDAYAASIVDSHPKAGPVSLGPMLLFLALAGLAFYWLLNKS